MMRKMKDSGVEWIGSIPEEWGMVRAKNIFTNHKYIVGDKESEYERLSLTLSGVLKRPKDDSKGLQSESFATYQILNEDELVFKMIDLENVSTSRVGYSPYTGIVSPVYIIFNNKKYTRYGYYYFYNMWQRTIFNRLGNDGVRSALNAGDMLNLPFPLLTEFEAKKIADFLDDKVGEIDAIVLKTKESIDEYKKFKQSIINEVVSNGIDKTVSLRETEIEFIDKIPCHWKEIKNNYLFRENVRPYREGDIPLSLSQADGLIPTDDMKERSLKTSSYDNWKRVAVDDLVLNRFKAHLGVLFASTLEGMVSFHYGVYEPQRKLVTKYYEYLYHSDYYKAIYAGMSNGMVVGLQNLSNTNFYAVKSLYPPYEEQVAIVDYLDKKCGEIDTLIAKKRAFIEEMETYKKSLIYEFVTGKKEVV